MEHLKLYDCIKHGQRFKFGAKKQCPCCINILKRIEENAIANIRIKSPKKLEKEVFWPREKGNGGGGRVIHNLEHKSVHFPTKRSFREYLKRNKVAEAR